MDPRIPTGEELLDMARCVSRHELVPLLIEIRAEMLVSEISLDEVEEAISRVSRRLALCEDDLRRGLH